MSSMPARVLYFDSENESTKWCSFRNVPVGSQVKWLSKHEASRALYIDFEGKGKGHWKGQSHIRKPEFVGVYCEGEYIPYVLRKGLKKPAKELGIERMSFRGWVERLIERSLEEKRVIVGFSHHERNMILRYTGIDIQLVYRDANAVAKKWYKSQLRGSPEQDEQLEPKRLKAYLDAINFNRQGFDDAYSVAQDLHSMHQLVNSREVSARASVVEIETLDRISRYNRVDCEGMAALMAIATNQDAYKPPRKYSFNVTFHLFKKGVKGLFNVQ